MAGDTCWDHLSAARAHDKYALAVVRHVRPKISFHIKIVVTFGAVGLRGVRLSVSGFCGAVTRSYVE